MTQIETLSPAAQANCAKLPELSYAFIKTHEAGNRIVVIKRGEPGYYPTTLDHSTLSEEHAIDIVDGYNQRMGVTEDQAAAMLDGSFGGFGSPVADPDFHARLRLAKTGAAK